MAIYKWKGKVETTVATDKNHDNDNKRTKYTHACTTHAKTSKEIICAN